MRFEQKCLIIGLIISAAVRLLLFVVIYPDVSLLTSSDQGTYVVLSDRMLQHFSFGEEIGADRLPLYLTFITLLRMIWNNLFFVIFIQNIIGLSAIYILYRIGMLYSPRIAGISALIAGCSLGLASYSNHILTESIFYPFFFGFLYYLLKYVETEQRNIDLVLAAVLLALSTLTRPVTFFMPVLVLIILFIYMFKTGFKKYIIASLVFLLTFYLILSPWFYRNHKVFGVPGYVTYSGISLIGWYVPEVARYEEGLNLSDAIAKYNSLWQEKAETLPASVKNNPFYLDKEAREFSYNIIFSSSPLSIIKAWTGGAIKNIVAPVMVELAYDLKMEWTHFYETTGRSIISQGINFIFFNKNKVYTFLLCSGIIATLLFRATQLFGLIIMFKKNKKLVVINLLIIGYFLAVNGPVGYAKYRLPFEANLILLTAFFIDWFWTKKECKIGQEGK